MLGYCFSAMEPFLKLEKILRQQDLNLNHKKQGTSSCSEEPGQCGYNEAPKQIFV